MLTLLLAATLLSDSLIAPGSGAAMCGALTLKDFASAGVPVTQLQPPGVEDDGASVYCTYASPAGKVELDVYFPTPNAKRVEEVSLKDSQGKFTSTTLPGTDDAQIGDAGSGKTASSLIVIRRGTAVLVLGIPQGPRAHEQLLALARIAVLRLRR